ncbi:TYRO3 kinase, partial [Atractosteus spatula]|nr:TYRO3 kinase [Atractosteus spatula]
FTSPLQGLQFTRNPTNLTVSQGNKAMLHCAVEGVSEPEIVWMKDGEKTHNAEEMYITVDPNHWETFYSVKSAQKLDAGKYWCVADFDGETVSSEPAWITVEGVPHFVVEPQDVAMLPGVPFNLSCAAEGPPEPVVVVWWIEEKQSGEPAPSPAVLSLPGINESIKVHCEARNVKGISVSRTGMVSIKGLPEAPSALHVIEVQESNVTISWTPGFNGYSPLMSCTVQMSKNSGKKMETLEHYVTVPPFQHLIGGLKSFSNYSARICCENEVGTSPFSHWVDFQTKESVPMVAPLNLTVQLTEQQLSLRWEALEAEQLNGVLWGYRVQWELGGKSQELQFRENKANLSSEGQFFNASFRVSACTAVGCGPWSRPVMVLPAQAPRPQAQRGHGWVALLVAVLTAVMLGLLVTVLIRRREKETQFGAVFDDVSHRAEPTVSFTAARSFNRQGPEITESTLDCLGISDELKTKLEDVLISERLLTLGHMLGKGEFGSVREAHMKMEDGSVRKVAVKVLKSDITSSCDVEQCLREAAYMKEFHHPNVIQLIGVSLQRRPQQRLPVPMVILPFMKHGDLHTFLLMSRMGGQPFALSLQTLVQFMLDIARGMEYLSSKNFIHRDLAARNCMLNEDMTVCVADFGLSKKIYSGDYYRQGSASKLPVKWIALESLADNIYTTQSDVWAFGVTMWEIMTRGQTPYPGVENSEIYEYLIKGGRLKQPPGCLDDIYNIMYSCWSPNPKGRPTFQQLIEQLEGAGAGLPPGRGEEELLYVNLAEGGEQEGQAGAAPWQHGEEDWPLMPAGAAGATGGDYRYIIGPRNSAEDYSRVGPSGPPPQQEEEEEDTVVDV